MVKFKYPEEGPDRRRFFTATAVRLSNMGMHLPSHLVEEGRQWYPTVHEVAHENARSVGITQSAASGIIAATSPNLEFDRNVNAVGQLASLDKADWKLIERSAARRTPDNRQMPRIPEVASMLREKAPAMVATYDPNLVKARRILHGEQWRDVLQSPKAFHFAGNIENPGADTGVTVDFRHGDIFTNQMWPAKQKRGLEEWRQPGGTPSRYEHMENITRSAAERAARMDPRFAGILPHDMQAILWVGGKWIEKLGGVRSVGVPRRGQPYTTATGAPLAKQTFWRNG